MQKMLENKKFIVKYSIAGRKYEKPIVASDYSAAYRIAYACCGNFKIEDVVPAIE